MQTLRRFSLLAALALGAFPALTPAGEAPAASAATQQETEKKLADARQRLDAAARDVAELSGQLGRRFNMQLNAGPGDGPPPRALLGVSIAAGADKDGAHVMDVSPGGPAAEVGIKSGDIITSVAGVDLTKAGNPGAALVDKMRQLEPDQKVKVGLLRDGKKLTVDVAPRPAPPGMMAQLGGRPGPGPMRQGERGFSVQGGPGPQGPGPEGRGMAGPMDGPQGRMQGGPMTGPVIIERRMEMRDGEAAQTRFGGVEVASLSERLGSYFGVKSGVLVVRAGEHSPFKLQDGDVILAIDGREATSAQQVGRILRTYQPGEKLTLKVQRDRKPQSIEVTAPGGGRRG
jgi:S1-C subfamily serine protease